MLHIFKTIHLQNTTILKCQSWGELQVHTVQQWRCLGHLLVVSEMGHNWVTPKKDCGQGKSHCRSCFTFKNHTCMHYAHMHAYTRVHAHTTNQHSYPSFIQSEMIFLASSILTASSVLMASSCAIITCLWGLLTESGLPFSDLRLERTGTVSYKPVITESCIKCVFSLSLKSWEN